MKYVFIAVYVFIFSLALVNCNPTGENGRDNPVPALSAISPGSKVAHMPSFTLTVEGSNFVSGSKIVFKGTEKETTFVSAAELTCLIDPDDTVPASPGVQGRMPAIRQNDTVPVSVRSPAPDGGDSNSCQFIIRKNHTFDLPKNITDNSGFYSAPANAVDSAGIIYVVWHDRYGSTEGDIYFSRSTDDGASWGQAVNISDNPGASRNPAIAIDNTGNIYVVWRDETPGYACIYFSRSTDGGSSWSRAVNVSNNLGDYYGTAMAVDGAGNICVVWHDYCSYPIHNGDIYFSRSTDGGVSWSQVLNISNNPGVSLDPAIAIDNDGNIGVAWCNRSTGPYGIYFSRSTDNGVSWSRAVNTSDDSRNFHNPAIAIDTAGNINILSISCDIVYCSLSFYRSTDEGASWSQAVNIFESEDALWPPVLAVDSAGNINIAWCDEMPGYAYIYFSRSIDGGSSWSQPAGLSDDYGFAVFPALAVDSAGNIDILWSDSDLSGEDICFTRSTR